jgi:hypothetical protein
LNSPPVPCGAVEHVWSDDPSPDTGNVVCVSSQDNGLVAETRRRGLGNNHIWSHQLCTGEIGIDSHVNGPTVKS